MTHIPDKLVALDYASPGKSPPRYLSVVVGMGYLIIPAIALEIALMKLLTDPNSWSARVFFPLAVAWLLATTAQLIYGRRA